MVVYLVHKKQQKAVEWGEKVMKEVGLDSVWLQPVMVPHWVRGEKEVANYTVNGTKIMCQFVL